MNNTKKYILAFLVLMVSSGAFSSEILSVEEMYKISKSNVITPLGKTFDEEIEKITKAHGFEEDLMVCVKNNRPHAFYGVYEFLDKKSGYKVYLKPKSAFSNCVSKLLEGRNLPIPPSYPYYSPFELNIN